MNLTIERPCVLFRNDYNGYSYYKIGMSKKSQTGEWINGYIRCKFKKGVTLENQTKINIKSSFLSFDLIDRKSIPCIVVTEFEIIDDNNKASESDISQTVDNMVKQEQSDPFKDFGEEIQLSDDDLPF